MMPTPKDAHIDAALTNISIAHKNQMFIGDRVFQNVPVKMQSDYYYIFRKGAWFRNDAGVRGPGANARRGGYPITSTTYGCKEYAFAHPIPIELLNNADNVLQPWRTGVKFATNLILLAKEVIVSTLCCTAGNWTTSNDVEGLWTAGAGNTFIEDMIAAKEIVRKLIGIYPNVLVLEAKTFSQLKMESSVLDRIKYTGTSGKPADVTLATLAQLFELDEVLLGGSIYSDAEEVVDGTDFNAVDLWETNATKGAAFLFYRPPEPAIEVPSAGYVFNWDGGAGQQDAIEASDIHRSVRYWWESSPKQWVVEASENFDVKAVSADAGYLFYDTIVT